MKDPLKQGLKHQTKQNIQQSFYYVEVKDPLKQGLKHQKLMFGSHFRNGWSERSIKTRIETYPKDRQPYPLENVEVKDPLKQGLKQSMY